MDTQAVLNTYAGLMTEIKSRHLIVLDLLANPRNYPDQIVMELTQLQIRMICETLALACLVAHGDIDAARSGKLTKAYQADYIINGLEKLNPDFYPRPTKQNVKDGVIDWEDLSGPYLTKAELVASYRQTGNFLHVGDLQGCLSRKQRTFDFNSVIAWGANLVALLNHHNIYLVDPPERREVSTFSGKPIPTRQIVAAMQGSNGKVNAHHFQRVVPRR